MGGKSLPQELRSEESMRRLLRRVSLQFPSLLILQSLLFQRTHAIAPSKFSFFFITILQCSVAKLVFFGDNSHKSHNTKFPHPIMTS